MKLSQNAKHENVAVKNIKLVKTQVRNATDLTWCILNKLGIVIHAAERLSEARSKNAINSVLLRLQMGMACDSRRFSEDKA